MQIAAVIIVAIALTAAFTACGGGSKSDNDSAQRETRRGDLIDDEFAEKSNVNLTGTWVSKFSNGNSDVFIFKTATEYDHYYLVEGEEMDHGTGTFTVNGNTVTMEELGDLHVMTIEGDNLVNFENGDRTVYIKQK